MKILLHIGHRRPCKVLNHYRHSVIVDDVENFPNAVAVFFGLHYIVNREYAGGKCSHMFQCLQTILPAPAGYRQGQNVTQSTVAEHKIFPSNFI